MRMLLLLAGLMLPLAAASQEIYRWVDRNGVVHYSDQPDSPDAKLIDVVEPNAYEPAEPADAADGAAAPGRDAESPAVSPYESLSIVSPTQDQAFFGANVAVTVTAELEGTLRPDHSVVFFVNGNRRPADGLGIELTNLARGTYFLRASILDQNGNPVISSQQTTFHIRQPSILSPQSPQARPRATAPRPGAQPAPPRPASPPGN